MSSLRRASKWIAGLGVRHAPAESRDWALAAAHELDAIESDWLALRWAVGGLRVLLSRPAADPLYRYVLLDQARKNAAACRLHAERTAFERYGPQLLLVVNLVLVGKEIWHTSPLAMVLSGLGMLLFLFHAGLMTPLVPVPSEASEHELLGFYRRSLQRSASFFSVARLVGPFLLMWVGFELAFTEVWARWLLALLLVLPLLFTQSWFTRRQQLAAVDQLLAEEPLLFGECKPGELS
jgi:hypothetical protein